MKNILNLWPHATCMAEKMAHNLYRHTQMACQLHDEANILTTTHFHETDVFHFDLYTRM